MPVFDATRNQVLFSPVTNYYQGKAMRQQLAAGEQDQEFKSLQIDAAKQDLKDAPGNKAKAEKLWQVQFKAAEANLETSLLENGEKTMEFMATSLSSLTADATEKSIAGDTEGALVDFNEGIQAAKSSFPAPIAEKIKSGAGEDGVYNAEELANLKMSLAPWHARDPSNRTQAKFMVDGVASQGSFDKAGNYYYGDGKPVLGKISPISAIATQGELSGGLSTAGLNSTTVAFREQVKQASAGASTATELVDISYDSPAAMAKSGSIITFGNELYVTAKNLVKTVASPALAKSETSKQDGGDIDAFDWGDIDTKMESLGVTKDDAARWKSGVYSIAFSAAVGEQGSRPSDKDIQAYIAIYGGQITDPSAFRATVAQAMRRQYNMLKFTVELNPEIVDGKQSLAVFENEYDRFLTALDGPRANINAPTVGTVVDGYRFNGGDPSDSKNWTKE